MCLLDTDGTFHSNGVSQNTRWLKKKTQNWLLFASKEVKMEQSVIFYVFKTFIINNYLICLPVLLVEESGAI